LASTSARTASVSAFCASTSDSFALSCKRNTTQTELASAGRANRTVIRKKSDLAGVSLGALALLGLEQLLHIVHFLVNILQLLVLLALKACGATTNANERDVRMKSAALTSWSASLRLSASRSKIFFLKSWNATGSGQQTEWHDLTHVLDLLFRLQRFQVSQHPASEAQPQQRATLDEARVSASNA
jgi:hypothetical protein